MRHPALDVADAAPGVEPRAERAEHGDVCVYTSGLQRDEEEAAEAVRYGVRAVGRNHLIRLSRYVEPVPLWKA